MGLGVGVGSLAWALSLCSSFVTRACRDSCSLPDEPCLLFVVRFIVCDAVLCRAVFFRTIFKGYGVEAHSTSLSASNTPVVL